MTSCSPIQSLTSLTSPKPVLGVELQARTSNKTHFYFLKKNYETEILFAVSCNELPEHNHLQQLQFSSREYNPAAVKCFINAQMMSGHEGPAAEIWTYVVDLRSFLKMFQ